MLKRLVASAAVVTGLGILILPGSASAHTAEASDSCSGLNVKVFIYPADVKVKVKIDGSTVHNQKGGGEWTFDWDSTQSHTWTVDVDDSGTQYDRYFEGEQDACVPATTTTTTQPPVVTTTTTQPEVTTTTTTIPEVTTTTTQPEIVTTTTTLAETTTTVTTAAPSTTAAPTTVVETSGPTTTSTVPVTSAPTTSVQPTDPTTTVVVPVLPVPTNTIVVTATPVTCDNVTQAEAQEIYNLGGGADLDADGDGIACEQETTLPKTGSAAAIIGWGLVIGGGAFLIGLLATRSAKR